MAQDFPVDVIDAAAAEGAGERGPFPFDMYERACLAQGDSWFSIGALPPPLTSNLLAELRLERPTVVVNCASPGKVLRHMTDTTSEKRFLRLLKGPLARRWDAILISGAGNDVIDAAAVGPAAPAALRLLARPDERSKAPAPGEGYLSEPGWQTFAAHITEVVARLVALRDAGVNRGVPIVLHDYAQVQPRPAGAGFGFGPWLHPALLRFAVPLQEQRAVADALLGRLHALLDGIVAAHNAADAGAALHLVPTQQAGLVAADAGATGRSGDFVNEIHPTRGGYEKAALAWQHTLDPLL